MLRIDFSEFGLLVRDERSRMREVWRALRRRIGANNFSHLPNPHLLVGTGRRANAVAAHIRLSSRIEKAHAVA